MRQSAIRVGEFGGHVAFGQHSQGSLRIGVRDHRRCADQLSAVCLDTLPRNDPGDGDARGEDRARVGGSLRDGKRDTAHAALDVAPDGAMALNVSLVMHQLHRRGPRIARAGERTDHALAEQRVLDALVRDVPVEGVRDRLGEHQRDELLVTSQHLLDLLPAWRGAAPRVAAGAVAQELPKAAEDLLVGDHAADIGRREPARPHVLGGALAVAEDRKGSPVGERAPEVGVADEDPVAPPLELELAHDDRVQEADDVRAGTDQVSGIVEGLLQRARAAELLSTLEYEGPPPGPGQVGSGGQPVVAAADDDRVPVASGESGDRLREPYTSERGADVDHSGQANGH